MPDIMDAETRRELKLVLDNLQAPVRLVFFKEKSACPTCGRQEELLRELCAVSGRLKLEVHDLVLDGDTALNYRIDKAPATAVLGDRDYGIRFYGLTAGHEFTSLLEAILLVSGGRTGLPPELAELVKKIDKPVHLEVMVTLDCPYCPEMVRVAHEFAFVNEHIRADMVEAAEFPEIVKKYQVTGVPRTIINGSHSFVGAMPAAAAYLEIVKAVAPEQYAALTEQLKAARGTDKTKKAEPGHLYEMVIVGGGPAAMSAAVYAARKQLDLALIAPKLGGQINYTSGIENYLGLAEATGTEMGGTFHEHMARYPVAEALGEAVTKIEKAGAEFLLTTDAGRTYNALSVVYCAGKEYKRLGAKGEDRFMGKGIAFCATCDAPLYKGKKVAVVGGGNSAFTAVRDLRGLAAEVHLIHRSTGFRADEVLVEEAKKAPNVVFHLSRELREYLGKGSLTGLVLASPDGKETEELAVDGVFLEIGLNPNSGPLKDLLPLTAFGEVAVDKSQATAARGLFAAGDVTDTEEKQISIAVGQGALAALSAYKYLADNGLTRSKAGRKDSWQ